MKKILINSLIANDLPNIASQKLKRYVKDNVRTKDKLVTLSFYLAVAILIELFYLKLWYLIILSGKSFIEFYNSDDNMYKIINKTIHDLSKYNFRYNNEKITIIQKVVMEENYDKQIKHLEQLKSSNEAYAYLSSHSLCSDRCLPYQGKLVSLNDEPINDKMECGYTLGGRQVYSFNGIINQIDKYGYKNNIIVGFNCKHKLIPYREVMDKPRIYKKEEVKKYYKVHEKIKTLERDIKALKVEIDLLRLLNSKHVKSTMQLLSTKTIQIRALRKIRL